MALTDNQRSDLQAGIYEYFLSRGKELAKCAEALAEADPEVLLRQNSNTNAAAAAAAAAATAGGGEENDIDNIKGESKSKSRASIGAMVAAGVPILEKKWTAVPRLQRRVLELERQLAASSNNNKMMMDGTSMMMSSMQLRERRNLPRPPATHTLQGHSSEVTTVAIHPIYTIAASGSEDGTIKLWDYESGSYLRTLRGHTNAITSVDYSPKNGYYLVSSSCDLSIKLWDVQEEYSCVRTIRGHDHTISCVRFVPPNVGAAYLETGGATTTTAAAAGGGGKRSASGGVDPSLTGAKFLVSASRDQTVKFWDIETGFCDYTLSDHGDWVRCLAVRPACSSVSNGGGGVDSGGATKNASSDKENDDLSGDEANNFSSTASMALVASSGNDRTIYVYNAHEKREKVCELRGHDHVVETLSFLCSSLLPQTLPPTSSFKQSSSAGAPALSSSSSSSSPRDYLASGSRDRTVRLWSIANGGSCLMTFRAHENWVRSVLVHPSGNHLLSCGDDRSIRVFDIKANRCLRTIEDAHSPFVTSVAMHPTLPIMISGGSDHAVKCWQLD